RARPRLSRPEAPRAQPLAFTPSHSSLRKDPTMSQLSREKLFEKLAFYGISEDGEGRDIRHKSDEYLRARLDAVACGDFGPEPGASNQRADNVSSESRDSMLQALRSAGLNPY